MRPFQISGKNIPQSILTHFPKGHLMAAGGLALALAAGLIISSSGTVEEAAASQLETTSHSPGIYLLPQENGDQEFLPVGKILDATLASTPFAPVELAVASNETEEAVIDESIRPREFVIKSGDSLSILFQRAGLNDGAIYELFNTSPDSRELRRIMPGQTIGFSINEEGKLEQLTYIKNELTSLEFTRTDKGFSSKKIEREPEIRTAFRHATITSSLFMAGKNAGMSNSMVMELANIFAWDIDFAQDIRRGDQFKVMFEEKFIDGKKIGNGAILAVEFINQGKKHAAVRYTDREGYTNYYTPAGESMRKAFLRMPVDFARISSHFNLNRRHPVLHTIRAHKGTDYAAPRGTPIKAAGDGKVVHAAPKGGYGNTVIIQHGQGYQTLYAHMHNFARNIKAGSRVRQGDIIGYVGTTGLSTGPHLHYEFHVNGVPKNPLTIDLPKTVAIDKAEKPNFLARTRTIVAQLDQYQTPTQIALADDTDPNIN